MKPRAFTIKIAVTLFSLLPLKIFAQHIASDPILRKIEFYKLKKSEKPFFVHYDKNIYTNNERVWFTAYLLKADSAEVVLHHTLAVALVREDDHSISLNDKFIMQNGVGFGNLLLPDTIAPGAYHLVAYTNLLNNRGLPVCIHLQSIMIKTTAKQSFEASVQLLDTLEAHNGVLRVAVWASGGVMPAGSKKTSTYTVKYKINGSAERPLPSDKAGQYLINIPVVDLNGGNKKLLVDVSFNNEIKHLSLKLPDLNRQEIDLHFYPEGGHMGEGVLNTVGWQAQTVYGQPLKVRGVLFKNGGVVDTISTNSYGIGKFNLLPESNAVYTLTLLKTNLTVKDTSYVLPHAIKYFPILKVGNAVVEDTLVMQIRNQSPNKLRVLIHNFRELYADIPLRTTSVGGLVRMGLQHVPRGIAAITVLDSVGRPVAERLFFAHYQPKDVLKLTTNKTEYKTREQINVQLKLVQKINNKPLQGAVSVACVQDNRLLSSINQDIESYAYLNYDLGQLPADPIGRGFSNKQYLEDVLLVKGWRSYSWPELMSGRDADTIRQFTSLQLRGAVKHFGKALSKPVALTVIRDTLFSLISTENTGEFVVEPNQMVIGQGKKLMFSLNQKEKDNYLIEFTDPFVTVEEKVKNIANLNFNASPIQTKFNTTEELLNDSHNKILKEVKIIGNKDDRLDAAKGLLSIGPNECGDYVCQYNVLNCPIHTIAVFKPIPGVSYLVHKGRELQPFIYPGCLRDIQKIVFQVKGRNISKTFYSTDYSMPGANSIPDYLSTIYWNHLIKLDQNGDATFSFPASDVIGKFRLVVQGLAENDMVFQQTTIQVSK